MSDEQSELGPPWSWWQARRLRYNLALAAAGLTAYLAALALLWAFGGLNWRDWRMTLSTTLLLGTGFLVLMGVANICYLIGPALEAWMRPPDPARYRKSAYALGFWGSVALPFAFPLVILAMIVGGAR